MHLSSSQVKLQHIFFKCHRYWVFKIDNVWFYEEIEKSDWSSNVLISFPIV